VEFTRLNQTPPPPPNWLKDKESKKRLKKQDKRYLIVLACGLGSILVLVGLIIYQYRSTSSWSSSKLSSSLSDVPAEFVQDNLSIGAVDDIELLAKVTRQLERVDKDKTVADRNTTARLVESAKEVLSRTGVDKGAMVENVTRLESYVQILDFLDSAYILPDSKQLEQLVQLETTRIAESNRDVDKEMLKRLEVVAKDYSGLNHFITKVLSQYGVVKDGTFVVSKGIEDFSSLVEEAESYKKYAAVSSLISLIEKEGKGLIENNKQLATQLSWLAFKTKLTGQKSNYVSANSITTLAEARSKGFVLEGLIKRSGFLISDSSPVGSLWVDGSSVPNTSYILSGVAITAVISPKYVEDPNYKPIIEPSTPPSSKKEEAQSGIPSSSSSSSSTSRPSSSSQPSMSNKEKPKEEVRIIPVE
jgi:hypothetical protein